MLRLFGELCHSGNYACEDGVSAGDLGHPHPCAELGLPVLVLHGLPDPELPGTLGVSVTGWLTALRFLRFLVL